jgi:hydrogenase maturation protease
MQSDGDRTRLACHRSLPGDDLVPRLFESRTGDHRIEAREGSSTLVLGLGNDILTDDAVGLAVVRALRSRLKDLPDVTLVECMEMGIALLDHITGYRNLVLVDSVQTGRQPPGHLHEVSPGDLSVLPRVTPHFLGIGETLRLGRQLDIPMPEEVRIFAIEVEDPFTLGEALSPSLQSALPAIIDRIEAAARELAR